ncbi:hypothetical protein ES708_17422 [subsurface metagenome]
MERPPGEIRFVIVALGRTYFIKDELKSLGFKWNQANKVWYHAGGLPTAQYEFLIGLRDANPLLDISFRHFEVTGNNWNEIRQ